MVARIRKQYITVICLAFAGVMLAKGVLAQSVSQAVPLAVPLNSAVLIYDRKSLEEAPAVVERIAALGDKRVMFVVTIHCRLTPELRPFELGLMKYRYRSWSDAGNYEPLDEALLAEYRDLLRKAFAAAAQAGMEIAILPHFDPAGDINEWRNYYDFDPLEEYRGYSYESSLIDSCIEALLKGTDEKTPIHFSLGGEMGRSAFAHADSYRKLTAKIRHELAGRPLSVGISLNHSGVTGEYEPTDAQQAEMHQLVEELDFIGFSNYSPFDLPPRANQFTVDCNRFLAAMDQYGTPVPEGKPLHFSEIGLGGMWRGALPEDAASAPQEGTVSEFRNPWQTDAMISLRRSYFDALLEFLRAQPGPRQVEAVYLWSEGSWEPLGVYKQAFRDEEIATKISSHNQKVREVRVSE